MIDKVCLIKSKVSIRDVAFKYGFNIVQSDFISCPFHSEKTPSLKIYESTNTWHCFGCGENGDVISFVQKLFDLEFQDALRRIDSDFGLFIYNKPSLSEYRRLQNELETLKKRREEEKKRVEEAEERYWICFDFWKMIDDDLKQYAPKSSCEEFHPLFLQALRNKDYSEYILECAEIEMRGLKHG